MLKYLYLFQWGDVMSDIIITNLSKLRDAKSNIYSSDTGNIEGVNTNDAPVKYLISLINSKGADIGKIIAVTTPEADTSFDAFCTTLNDFAESLGICLPHPTKVRARHDSFAETIYNIVSHISKGDSVWIDTTGGFRNSSYLLMAVSRILEYSDIKVEKAVYSNFEEYKINDVTDIYHLFDLINAANSFTSFGNSDELFRFFKDCRDEKIKEVISAMSEFSEAVALCRTSSLDNILQRLNDSLSQLGNTSSAGENEILFRSISGVIKDKFSIGNDKKIDCADVILWCVQNKMIQQAVTIYTEKGGEYLYNRYFTVCDDEMKRINSEKTSYDNLCYRLFYMGLMNMETTPLGQVLRNSLKDKNLRNAVILSENMGDFQKTLSSDSLSAEQKHDLKKFFKLKRIFYNCGTRRNKDEISAELMKYPEYAPFEKITAKSFEGFLNAFYKINDRSWLKIFYSDRTDIMQYNESRLNTIEQLDKAYTGQTDYQINIPINQMQDIMRDYLYIKNRLRNAVNHANDNNEQTAEMMEYFRKYGYNTDNSPSLYDVTEIIKNAVKRLKGEDLL